MPGARYSQVAATLRQAIQRGDYEPGQALPSEAVLAEQHDLSRVTINKAVRVLVAEGLVRIERGRGVYVRERRPVIGVSSSYVTRHGTRERAQWADELAQLGMTGTQALREVVTTTAPDDVAGWLRLDDDEQVVVRRRTLYADHEPVQLLDSYYPADLAGGTELAETGKLSGGSPAALERLGISLGWFHERVWTQMPSRAQMRLLALGAGIPVLVHVRVAYTTSDEPVEVSEAIMAGDRHVLSYDLPAHEPERTPNA